MIFENFWQVDGSINNRETVHRIILNQWSVIGQLLADQWSMIGQ